MIQFGLFSRVGLVVHIYTYIYYISSYIIVVYLGIGKDLILQQEEAVE